MKRTPWIVAMVMLAASVLVARADTAPTVQDVGPKKIVLTPHKIDTSPMDQLAPEARKVAEAFDQGNVTGFAYDAATRTLRVATALVGEDTALEWKSDCNVNNTQFSAPDAVLAQNNSARGLLEDPLIALVRLRYQEYAHFEGGTASVRSYPEANLIEVVLQEP